MTRDSRERIFAEDLELQHPVEDLLAPSIDSIRTHLVEEHRWPRHVCDDATDTDLVAWHAAEHRAMDAPKDPAQRHAGHLHHRHTTTAARSVSALSAARRRRTTQQHSRRAS